MYRSFISFTKRELSICAKDICSVGIIYTRSTYTKGAYIRGNTYIGDICMKDTNARVAKDANIRDLCIRGIYLDSTCTGTHTCSGSTYTRFADNGSACSKVFGVTSTCTRTRTYFGDT